MVLNIGPQHPSTHGVLRLIALISGELIVYLLTEIGLLHRGTEKLIESNYFNSSIPYFDRLDYVSNITQEVLFINGVERLINCIVSNYISSWRTLFFEYYRVLNHILNITTHAIDIGLFTTMLWGFDEREKLLNYIELISGTRFHVTLVLVGRLRYDIRLNWINSLTYWLLHFLIKLKEIVLLLSKNRIWRTRLNEIAIINTEFSIYFGLTGIILRSCGNLIDARLIGYEFYCTINWSLFIALSGDCLDRYLLRMNELIESLRIIYINLYLIVNSFILTYSSLSNIVLMELLINDFFIHYPLLLASIQSVLISIESSKGIYSLLLYCFPCISINIVTSDFICISVLNNIIKYHNVGDLVAIIGSIDFVLGSVDLFMFSYLSSNIIYNEIEYILYINIWLLTLFITVLVLFILINSCLLSLNSIQFNSGSIELLITLLSIIFLLVIISPSLIILLDSDSIVIPSIILYSIGYQWAWQFNLYFSTLFITYIDQRIIPFNLLINPLFTVNKSISTRLLINNESLLIPLYCIMKFFLLSYDVIHSISYYSLGIKIDAIPSRINITNSIRPLIKGEYRGYCFELCGQGHSIMILTSIVSVS